MWSIARDGNNEIPELPPNTPSFVEPDEVLPKGYIQYHGDANYSIGRHEPIAMGQNEDLVLLAFLRTSEEQGTDCASITGPDLDLVTGISRTRDVLKRLRKKREGMFRSAIQTPGSKAGGGYRVRIVRIPDDPGEIDR